MITRTGFSGSDDEVHFNSEGVASWGGSVEGARRFFVKVYNDGGRFGGIKNSSRSSLLRISAAAGFITGKNLTVRQRRSRPRGSGTTKLILPFQKRSTS